MSTDALSPHSIKAVKGRRAERGAAGQRARGGGGDLPVERVGGICPSAVFTKAPPPPDAQPFVAGTAPSLSHSRRSCWYNAWTRWRSSRWV